MFVHVMYFFICIFVMELTNGKIVRVNCIVNSIPYVKVQVCNAPRSVDYILVFIVYVIESCRFNMGRA